MNAIKKVISAVLVLMIVLSAGIIGVTAVAVNYSVCSDIENSYKDFIKKEMETVLRDSDMTQKELLAEVSSQMGISSGRAYELELEAGLHTPWSRDESPTVPATKPVEDTTAVPAETTTAPSEDVTTAPAEKITTVPAEDITTEPAEDVTTVPAQDITTEPVEDITTAPAEDITTEPVEDTTTVPAEDVTTEPAQDVTTAPVEDITTAPEEGTTAPADKTEPATTPSEPEQNDTTDDESSTDEADTYRYYFYKPGPWIDSKYSDTVGIYWWDGTDACTSWPGYEAKKTDFEGVYYYDVPKDVTTIIWNNFLDGGMDPEAEIYHYAYQTNNIPCEYYDPEESVLYPEGTESFDGMIFVCNTMIYVSDLSAKTTYNGTWYYYYGNGEYGITPEKGEKFYTGSYQVDEPTTNDYEDIGYILGDVNGDRKLNIRDATRIQKYLAKLTVFNNEQVFLGDFNEDKVVNIKDATTIQKKLANVI